MALLTVNASSMTVGLPDAKTKAAVQTVIAGSSDQILAPIPATYLATAHEQPQVDLPYFCGLFARHI